MNTNSARSTLRSTLTSVAIASGVLCLLGRKLPLAHAREGHVAVETGGAGKIVLVP